MKFKCKLCGNCCQNLGALPLFEWEAQELKELAKEKDIKLDIRPFPKSTHLDKKTGKTFCFLFGLFNSPCPFLLENKCSIYGKRPLICRQFPIIWTPSFAPGKKFGTNCFLNCPNFDHKTNLDSYFSDKSKAVPKKEVENILKEIYGECYNFALQSNKITHFIAKLLRELDKERKIKIRKVKDSEIKPENVIPFLDFLVQTELISQTKKDSLIFTFKQN